ncbi:putative Dynein intermediate chain 2, ciliary [Blattamonas nauphoetae]|uniref:Dynein intermediate chain 2, ciliary n=1 Tax=Blattamonas nauphoetae TaxID=2049346 RepID=A0ABQ9XP44_9EUKA|nr:putative Dynein intermediate chain 2, ciliary [Blattamonas nauphoetae]
MPPKTTKTTKATTQKTKTTTLTDKSPKKNQPLPSASNRPPMTSTGLGGFGRFGFDQQKQVIKPANQLKLSETELNEEFQLMLNTTDSFMPSNIVRFNFKDKQFKSDTNITHTRTHFSLDGKAVYQGSGSSQGNQASGQQASEGKAKLANAFNISTVGTQTQRLEPKTMLVDTDKIVFEDFSYTVTQWDIFDSYMQDQERQKVEKEKTGKKPGIAKKAANQDDTPLIPLPKATPMPANALEPSGGGVIPGEFPGLPGMSGESLLNQQSTSTTSNVMALAGAQQSANVSFETDPGILRALQVLERMTLQNTFEGISEDYKFWEDPSDAQKGDSGGVLPLWTFVPSKREAKKKTTTCIAWHPRYPDFFAVGYGTFEFNKQSTGAVAVYTLKNHLNPEYFFTFDSSVLSIAWNRKHPPYLAVGLSNGVVLSFDIRDQTNTLSVSKLDFNRRKGDVKGKHTDCVWGVVWEEEMLSSISDDDDELMKRPDRSEPKEHDEKKQEEKRHDGEEREKPEARPRTQAGGAPEEEGASSSIEGVGTVLSVSSDGRVTRWRREKDRMVPRDVMEIKGDTDDALDGGEDDEEQGETDTTDQTIIFSQTVSGCSCVSVHPTRSHLALIGTEEAIIHKVTKSYNGETLQKYSAHKMPVYSVAWNPMHPRVFLSAGADWSVFLWDHTLDQPQLEFAFGSSIGDVAWAPFSATIFAMCSADGKVYVFDLNINRQEPLCEVQLEKNTRLTKIAFSAFDPVILVGDEKGKVHTLKLSPNLRKSYAEKNSVEEEIERMEKVLDYAIRCKEAGM